MKLALKILFLLVWLSVFCVPILFGALLYALLITLPD
jgi:hypothetical protein